MKKETMTGKERIKAAVNFKDQDRIPVFPLTHWGTAGLFGISVEDYTKNSEIQSKCLIDACRMFDYDGVNAGVDVIIEAEAHGGLTEFKKDSPPFLKKHPLGEDKNKLKDLKVLNPETTGRMHVEIETCKILVSEIGKEKFTHCWIMGPLNCASQLRGVQDTAMDFILDPDYLEKLLDFATEQVLAYGKALAKTGLDCIGIGEALASPNFNSPDSVYKYVWPRYIRLIKGLHEAGVLTMLHICGNIYPLFKLGEKLGKNIFKETGADILDIDWQVKMEDAINSTGLCCRGNLDPSSVLAQGSKEKVLEESKKIIQSAGPTKGLILGAGCDMSYYTPKENYAAMVQSVRDFGFFPIKDS
ncbi:MAG: uroporphyrinogen decarboxylase family protein [Actinobacteria bacterium]|nr:uroporphyrinogen decarboxylase family protein [Actinomycetota bacterium]